MLFCSLTSQYNIYECPTGLGNLGGKQELDLGQDELEELANEAFVRLISVMVEICWNGTNILVVLAYRVGVLLLLPFLAAPK